jgi:two-component system, OmpR family, copper resistance phosphate regulon response regulator CusR
MMKVLVVEDEPKVASFIKKGLEEQSYEVQIAYDGMMGKRKALSEFFDIIIMDINLPVINGYDLCKQLRTEHLQVPIIMLTALGTTDDKLSGFDSGTDDYLIKPFEFRELLARIRALTKRTAGFTPSQNLIRFSDLELNLDEKIAKRGDKKIELTAKEFALLEYFLRNRNKVISRADIAEKVWDITFDTGTNVIDVYVNFLRKKIDKDYPKKLIHTVVGMGYILKEDLDH